MATIGVYGFDLERFLVTLRAARVGLVVDVRQRRGVRGPEYAWANAGRLTAALDRAGIGYRHERGLAPTTELRHLQYAEDARQGVGKRSRVTLAPEYARRYVSEILDAHDLAGMLRALPVGTVAALLCVERDAAACHRSLVAARLQQAFGVRIRHLRP